VSGCASRRAVSSSISWWHTWQDTPQKWTSTGWPSSWDMSIPSVLNVSVAPSRDGSGLPRRSGISLHTSQLSLHLDEFLARSPVRAAQIAGLQGLQDPQTLVDVAAHVVVVYHLITYDALWVDDEKTAQGDAFFFIQHTVSPGNFLGNVRSQREVDGTEAALVFGRPDPSPVRVD